MLYRSLRRLIEFGKTEGLEEKIDFFHTAKSLTDEECMELKHMLASLTN